MICQECKDAGEKSTVEAGWGTTTCMGWTPFYDEEGVYHSHNPNRRSRSYSCSKGHSWWEDIPNTCPNCDYGEES